MRCLTHMKFQTKINLVITSVVLFFGLVSAILVSRTAMTGWFEESQRRGMNMAENMAARAVDPMLGMDFFRLKRLIDDVQGLSDYFHYAFIQDAQGDVMVHTFRGGFPVELIEANAVARTPGGPRPNIHLLDTGVNRIYDFAAPIRVGDNLLGTVRLGITQASVRKTLNRILFTIFSITGTVALLAVLLGSFFAVSVSRRINLLRESAEEMVKGNLDIQAGPMLAKNCWEIMNCDLAECPAYGDTRRRCWYQAGTLCPTCRDLDMPEKFESCRDCKVFQLNTADEIQSLAETFDVMALTLRAHVNELETAQQDILRQKQLLKTILDVTPDLVSLQDENQCYKAVNKAFCTFFNLTESEVLGKTDFDFFPDKSADIAFHENSQILLTGRPMSKQILLGGPDNRRWFHVIKVPVTDGEGIIGLLLTARDISVIKQYQDRLVQSQKMEDLGRLAGGVAHEINTPLGIILGYAQLLLEDAPPGTQLESDLSTIEKQSKVCRQIVADLLGFSRNIDSSMEEMDLNSSVREVVAVVEHIFKQERVSVHLNLDDSVPPIKGDKDKLKQVWMNLLNNAFDAVGSDGRIIASTKLCSHRKRVVVAVADTGGGITQKDMKNVFDPFFTTKPSGRGTGLGLSISFGIIKDHKGKISAVSPAPMEYLTRGSEDREARRPGPGTVFFIELPLTDEGLPDEECPEIAALKSSNDREGNTGEETWQS